MPRRRAAAADDRGGRRSRRGLTTLAGILAASYTVITYDRRGNSRSPLYHDPVKITIAGQSADAVAVLRPGTVRAPGPYRDLMQRLSGNWEYLTRFEMQSFIGYLPDLIAASRIPVALAAGTDTIALAERADLRHDPFHRPCTAIAARLGAEFAEFPGGHLAPMELPEPFAAGLRDVFGRL